MADMRAWPYEAFEADHVSGKRICNGWVHNIRWAVMGRSGYIAGANGYAQIPWEGHPWTGCTDYDDLDVSVHGGLTYGPKPSLDFWEATDALIQETAGTDHPIVIPGFYDKPRPPAHPAVTFADCGGWIGFDTLHAWDVWSDEELARMGLVCTEEAFRRALYGTASEYQVHWTLELVTAAAMDLARQIHVVGEMADIEYIGLRKEKG
jgi:hypothetical protein